jgi:hypothetical protein
LVALSGVLHFKFDCVLDIWLNCDLVYGTRMVPAIASARRVIAIKVIVFIKKPGRLVAGKSCGMSHIMVEFMGPICPQLAPPLPSAGTLAR